MDAKTQEMIEELKRLMAAPDKEHIASYGYFYARTQLELAAVRALPALIAEVEKGPKWNVLTAEQMQAIRDCADDAYCGSKESPTPECHICMATAASRAILALLPPATASEDAREVSR